MKKTGSLRLEIVLSPESMHTLRKFAYAAKVDRLRDANSMGLCGLDSPADMEGKHLAEAEVERDRAIQAIERALQILRLSSPTAANRVQRVTKYLSDYLADNT